ncbi:hypothetical protein [Halorubellus salinus]|uniref:hypothetical protein n=1 Tax=Halorubellus salinus TaxID=755309 RepID=UPI001D06E88D|nr:hypothetical protein [Halorubellus salinus]
MHRLRHAAVLTVLVVALAGCQAGPGGGPGTSVEYSVAAAATDMAPGNASTVDASAPELADVDAVHEALSRAAEDADGYALVTVSEQQFGTLNRTVASLPGGVSSTSDEVVAAMVYVEYEGTVYRVTVEKRRLV